MSKKESDLEQQLIQKLQDLKYVYRPEIHTRAALEANFREKFDQLNHVTLTDNEFERLLEQTITADTFDASKKLRTGHTMLRDDDTPLDYTLINIKDWCKNSFEVVSQLRMNTKGSHHRYDVILLMNGVPVVQIELKRNKVPPQVAMKQVVDYKNDLGNGYTNSLLCFIQIFINSNGNSTQYFANNNQKHFAFDANERYLPVYRFSDESNNQINILDKFADAFLTKCVLGETISKFMVLLETEQRLMIMRPYQIYAVKAILSRIAQNAGNGYIWHTTGSGKTLTSFRASTLLRQNDAIDKCIFVVDRKDLDQQTREEFNRFQAGSVEENANTGKLVRRLLSTDTSDKVIVTTIQKLGLALSGGGHAQYQDQLAPLKDKRIVFIFDECHRSQFGENHRAIKEYFPNSQLFGFTGTPIFEENARLSQRKGTKGTWQTTKDVFEQQLHAYTISDAIGDKNVLKFHVDYYTAETLQPEHARTGQAPPRKLVIDKILEKHHAATANRKFNAIMATSSIDEAIGYYGDFQEVQAQRQVEDPTFVPLSIAAVFSPPASVSGTGSAYSDDLEQEKEDHKKNPEGKKAALEAIISEYNARYRTNFNIYQFDDYYRDVQKRLKDQQWPNRDYPQDQKIDIVIVVDMLLTGFDSKYLNTLYLDKNLRYHGLIQAMSRTNRILNATKPHGNILDFRGQKDEVDKAIRRFSRQDKADDARKEWLVQEAPEVIAELRKAARKVASLLEDEDLEPTPDQVHNLKKEALKILFIERFQEVQKLVNQLSQYTDLTDQQRQEINEIISPDSLQGFRGVYLELVQELKQSKEQPQDEAPEDGKTAQDIDFELVNFASVMIDYDYIMTLLAYSSAKAQSEDDEEWQDTLEEVISLVKSISNFDSDRTEFIEYITSLRGGMQLTPQQMQQGFDEYKEQVNAQEVSDLAAAHSLDRTALQSFIDETLSRRIFDGDRLRELFTPLELGWKERKRREEGLMGDLVFLLQRRANGRDIAGLEAYEQ